MQNPKTSEFLIEFEFLAIGIDLWFVKARTSMSNEIKAAGGERAPILESLKKAPLLGKRLSDLYFHWSKNEPRMNAVKATLTKESYKMLLLSLQTVYSFNEFKLFQWIFTFSGIKANWIQQIKFKKTFRRCKLTMNECEKLGTNFSLRNFFKQKASPSWTQISRIFYSTYIGVTFNHVWKVVSSQEI